MTNRNDDSLSKDAYEQMYILAYILLKRNNNQVNLTIDEIEDAKKEVKSHSLVSLFDLNTNLLSVKIKRVTKNED
jgi:hypothetical protein